MLRISIRIPGLQNSGRPIQFSKKL